MTEIVRLTASELFNQCMGSVKESVTDVPFLPIGGFIYQRQIQFIVKMIHNLFFFKDIHPIIGMIKFQLTHKY